MNISLGKKVFLRWRKILRGYTWWELTVFIIGSVSFFSILAVLFLPLKNGPDKFFATSEIPAVSTTEFLSTVSHSLNLPLLPGEEIKILNNGDEFMESLLSDIDAAQSSINIMTFIWDKGVMSDKIFEHLIPKLKEGVKVRIMLDAFGGFGVARKKEFEELRDLGGKVEIFHSLTAVPWNISSNHKRNHRRAIVIDGDIGYTGGMAISDAWLGDARDTEEYRDMMFRMTGNMAGSMQGAFAELWTSDTGEFLAGGEFFPSHENEEKETGDIQEQRQAVRYIPLHSTPHTDSLALQKFFLLSLMGGKEKIYIATPYMLPDPSFNDILIEKAKSGLDVRVLLPNDNNDSAGVRRASQSYYEDLLRGGVRIYEYQPTLIHSKTMVVDGIWSVIGSANIDPRSRELNSENVLGVWDSGFGASLESVFLEDLGAAREIKPDEWEKRGLWQRFREIFALKFVEQY